jgi:hypothetical protein
VEHLTPTQKGAVAEAAITAYSPEIHRCFLIPISEASERRSVHLRLEPTKNNQVQRIKWARDYDFATAIGRLRPGAARG